ncbi:MAG: RND transporter [Bacteroidetes bacterium]|nr:MAG: RND transporter [Bacteroidota bacterium]
MFQYKYFRILLVSLSALSIYSCKGPALVEKSAGASLPQSFGKTEAKDSTNLAQVNWQDYFKDPLLIGLINTALKNNQELNISLQEIAIGRNEVQARRGEYLPFVGLNAGAGLDKPGRYTSKGANDAITDIAPGTPTPDPLNDFYFGAFASWEIDIWSKLHNAKNAATKRYLASVEGQRYMVTNLVAEIASDYYELVVLDRQLEIVEQNITLQSAALRTVKLQKASSKVTELAVKRFEAQLLNTKSLQFGIKQSITETSNHLNYLLGRYPQEIPRSPSSLDLIIPDTVYAGLPSQLLANRPDIRAAEQKVQAAKLDLKVAKANFYPSLDLSAGIGYQAFKPSFLLNSPQSLLYNFAGDLGAPLINRRAIKATYYNANAKQIQALYEYEATVLQAYVEVINELSRIQNLQSSYQLKSAEVSALNSSVKISNSLFQSARADYMEVLLTQREALQSRFELIETKKQQIGAMVNIYRALGGGWK